MWQRWQNDRKGQAQGSPALGRGLRVSPSSLGKGLRTSNLKTAPPKPKSPSLPLRTGSQRPGAQNPPTVSQQDLGTPRPPPQQLSSQAQIRPPPFLLRPHQAQAPAPPTWVPQLSPVTLEPVVPFRCPGTGQGQRHLRFLPNQSSEVSVAAAFRAAGCTRCQQVTGRLQAASRLEIPQIE